MKTSQPPKYPEKTIVRLRVPNEPVWHGREAVVEEVNDQYPYDNTSARLYLVRMVEDGKAMAGELVAFDESELQDVSLLA